MPTIVYKFGLMPPTMGGDLLNEQLRAGHDYYNALVKIEHDRRDAIREALGDNGDTAPLAERVAKFAAEIKADEAAIKKKRARSRSRSETKEERAELKAKKARLREMRVELREKRRALRDDPMVTEAIAVANKRAQERRREERAKTSAFWGTYLLAERAIDQASDTKRCPLWRRGEPNGPSFRRARNSDQQIGVQVQGGVSWVSIVSGSDQRLQLDPDPMPVPGRKGKPRPRIRLRIGSTGPGCRVPIWAEWPVILHRDVPMDATVTWAQVKREVIEHSDWTKLDGHRPETKHRWTLHLTLRIPDQPRRKGPRGAVAINPGWRLRRLRSDVLRVAYLLDDKGEQEEFILDPGIRSGIQKTRDLQEIRDRRLNEMAPKLIAWLKENRTYLPEWLEIASFGCHITKWRGASNFAALALRWRGNRFDGDAEGFDLLEAWRKKDKHLWSWMDNQLGKSLRRRKDQYRVLGARLARRYRTLLIDDTRYSDMQRNKALESDDVDVLAVKRQQREASPYELRETLVAAFVKAGGIVVTMPSPYITATCHACGTRQDWDHAETVHHFCAACDEFWDQDENACENLMAAWRERSSDTEIPGSARVKDYGTVQPARQAKWAKRGRHK